MCAAAPVHRACVLNANAFLPHTLRMRKQGFDEFMNVTLDDAEEVWVKVTKAKPAAGEGEDAAGATTASRRPKREYGDRRPLGAAAFPFYAWVSH